MNIDMINLSMNKDNNIIHTKRGTYIINMNALKKILKLENNTINVPCEICLVRNNKHKISIAKANSSLEKIFIMENKLETLKKRISSYKENRALNIFNSTMTEIFDIIAFLGIGTFLFTLDLNLISKVIISIISYLPSKHVAIKIFGTRKENIKKRKELRKLKESFPDIENQIFLLEKELAELKKKCDYKKISFTTLSNTIDSISKKPIIEYIEGDETIMGYKPDYDIVKIEEKPKTKDIEIEITYIDNIIKVDIKDDCNIIEYMNAIRKLDAEDINKNIFNSILFDTGGLDVIHKKTIYIVNKDNKTYNICNDFNCIYIDEHIKYENNNADNKLYIDQKIIKVNKDTKEYEISRLKHEKSLSTYYVKFFDSENPNQLYFKLDQKEALEVAKETLNNLSKIDNIEKIINFDLINKSINTENSKQKILKKEI